MKNKQELYNKKRQKRVRIRNCKNKKRYQNETMAMAQALDCQSCGKINQLYYYKCKECDGYHLTKSPGSTSKLILV